jgi:hypothetical protein
MALNPLLTQLPFGSDSNPDLWSFKYEVDDERFLQIIRDLSCLIKRSEVACKNAARIGNDDYANAVADTEADYIEELIGASFLVLQTKIRRVTNTAERLRSYLLENKINVPELQRADAIKIGGRYKRKRASLVELVWDV